MSDPYASHVGCTWATVKFPAVTEGGTQKNLARLLGVIQAVRKIRPECGKKESTNISIGFIIAIAHD